MAIMKMYQIQLAELVITLKKLYGPFFFYGWGSTASRLEPLRGGSLLFTFFQYVQYTYTLYIYIYIYIYICIYIYIYI